MDESLIGRTIAGKFVIESHVGDGAMGAVYKAHQIALEKTVAIKVLHRGLVTADSNLAARFHREALAASRLDHPSSIRVLDFGEEPDGLLYLAMELVEGRNLHDIACDESPFDDERVVNILSQVLAALAVAHEMGVIHRDLKPENIMVLDGVDDEGRPTDVVKVCDFGIATIAEPRSDREPGARSFATGTGAIVGTPEYMSPEQARGERLDPRSDLYSLGIVLFRLITGGLPFHAETALGVVLKQIMGDAPRPSEVASDVSPELEAICIKAMSKSPEDRYASAREMRAALRSTTGRTSRPAFRPLRAVSESARADLSVAPLAPTLEMPKPPGKPPKKASKRPLIAALAASGLLIAAGIFAMSGEPSSGSEIEASRLAAESHETATPTATATATAEAPAAETSAAPPAEPTSEAEANPSDEPSKLAAAALAPASPSETTDAPAAPPKTTEPSTTLSAEPSIAPPYEPSAPPSAAPAPGPTLGAGTAVATLPPAETAKPAPKPAAPLPPFDPSRARVNLASVTAAGGIPAAEARTALNHAAFTSCYRGALAALGRPAGGTASLHLAIDETGRIRSAVASGMGFLPSAKGCIESAARAIRVRNVDTGDASADATLSFVPQ